MSAGAARTIQPQDAMMSARGHRVSTPSLFRPSAFMPAASQSAAHAQAVATQAASATPVHAVFTQAALTPASPQSASLTPAYSTPAAPRPAALSERSLVLAACLMATFMAAIEGTIVATAMPSIVGELGGFDLFSWVFTIFLLTQAVSIPVYGRLADMFGRKTVFFLGVGLFLTGSVLCGLAWSMVSLIAFRAVQGLGAGAVQPIAATILGDIYTPAERAVVQGLVSCVFGVSAVVGPSLGAFLIGQVSWSWIFWVNLPIGVLSLVMVGVFLRETATPRPRSIDWPGALLMLLATGSLILGMVQGGQFSPVLFWAVMATSLCAALLLLIHESVTPEPMLPLELWRDNRVIVTGSLGSCAAGALMMGISAFLPAYVQGAMGLSAMAGGLVLGAMSVSWALASLLGAKLMLRTTYRMVALLGALALVLGTALLIVAPSGAGPVPVTIGSFIVGIGMGFCISVFVVSIQASVEWHQRGAATSSTMFLRFMGQVIGASGCGAVLNLTILRLDPGAGRAIDKMLDPVSRAALPAAEVAHLTEIIALGLRNAWLLAGLFALAAFVFAWLMPKALSARTQTAVQSRAGSDDRPALAAAQVPDSTEPRPAAVLETASPPAFAAPCFPVSLAAPRVAGPRAHQGIPRGPARYARVPRRPRDRGALFRWRGLA